MRMTHIFGYPVKLTACIDGRWIDVTSALVMTGNASGIELDTDAYLDAVAAQQEAESARLNCATFGVGLPD